MADSGNAALAGTPSTVFLLTSSAVMTQQGGTKLWHAVEAGPAPGGPTASQLRALRRERARRQHPAGSAHRSAPARGGAGPSGPPGAARFEIFDSLTGCWSPVPATAGPSQVADALCWVLPDGKLLVGGLSSTTYSTYDPISGRWTMMRAGGDLAKESSEPARKGAAAGRVVIVRLSD
ncbi:MAG TPA: hypothetical protein VKY26_09610 [Actinomycetota bacterium]|nr:hypothetical protein [Actinomycetota bacterium]